jgi:hypothetical protein
LSIIYAQLGEPLIPVPVFPLLEYSYKILRLEHGARKPGSGSFSWQYYGVLPLYYWMLHSTNPTIIHSFEWFVRDLGSCTTIIGYTVQPEILSRPFNPRERVVDLLLTRFGIVVA